MKNKAFFSSCFTPKIFNLFVGKKDNNKKVKQKLDKKVNRQKDGQTGKI